MFRNLLLTLFSISPPPVVEDQDPEGEPSILPSTLRQLLGLFQDRLSGPNRAIFVIEFNGVTPTHCRISTAAPDADGTSDRFDQFSQDCHRIWHSYSVGRTIPIVMCRLNPSPFVGIMVMPLPWARIDSFCMQCGSADHATSAHADHATSAHADHATSAHADAPGAHADVPGAPAAE